MHQNAPTQCNGMPLLGPGWAQCYPPRDSTEFRHRKSCLSSSNCRDGRDGDDPGPAPFLDPAAFLFLILIEVFMGFKFYFVDGTAVFMSRHAEANVG